jgi:hypothetical protein
MDKVLDKATNTSYLSLSRSFSTLHKERISQPDKSMPQVIPRKTRMRKAFCLAYLTPPSHPACSSRVRPQPKVPPIRGISCRTEARCKGLEMRGAGTPRRDRSIRSLPRTPKGGASPEISTSNGLTTGDPCERECGESVEYRLPLCEYLR